MSQRLGLEIRGLCFVINNIEGRREIVGLFYAHSSHERQGFDSAMPLGDKRAAAALAYSSRLNRKRGAMSNVKPGE